MLPAAQCVCPKICCCLLLLPASAAASSFKSVQNAPKMDPQLSRNSAQLSCNSAELQAVLFKRLSCTFRGLSCTPQLTAIQSPATSKKHCKTRATQRNSLQLKGLRNHSKNKAELQPQPPLNPNPPQARRPKKRTKRKRFNVDTLDCNVSALAEAIQRTFRHPPPPLRGAGRSGRFLQTPASSCQTPKASAGHRLCCRPFPKNHASPF